MTVWQWILCGVSLFGVAGAILYIRIISDRAQDRTDEMEELKEQVLEWNRRLEEKVTERTQDLELAHRRLQENYLETVTALVEALTAKDTYLFSHSHNVAVYAKAIAEELKLSKERIDRLLHGCELHDLGKIAVPDTILMKPGPLTREEFEVVKQHPVWGARILGPLSFMKDINDMVHEEHERWDGTGYPRGLKGEQIRLEARIISVADALDAMVSDRPYRQRLSLDQAAQELDRCAGTQFDSRVVEACLRAIEAGKLIPAVPQTVHAHHKTGSSHHPA